MLTLTKQISMPDQIRQASADSDSGEIEVTPQMLEAGVFELMAYDWESESLQSAVRRIIGAVFRGKAVTLHELEKPFTERSDHLGILSELREMDLFVNDLERASRFD